MKGPGNTVMKKNLLKIFIPATLILLGLGVFLGVNLYQKNTSEMYLGELQSLHYEFGGSNKQYWNFAIEKTGDGYTLTIEIGGTVLSGEIDDAAIEGLMDIIVEQDLFAQNGVESRDENLCDGFMESLKAEFKNCDLSFSTYLVSTRRNDVLCDYLLELAEGFELTKSAE